MKALSSQTAAYLTWKNLPLEASSQNSAAPIHSLQDIKELGRPYTEADIKEYLHDHHLSKMGDSIFDDGTFQCALYDKLFYQIEKNEIQPGQPEHDRPAQYFLKKTVELLKPLGVKIGETDLRYKNMLQKSTPGSPLHTKLEKEVAFIASMVSRFSTIERNLLEVLTTPGFRPTRDKACFLLFVHAMLADAANQAHKWMNDLVDVSPEKVDPPWHGLIFSYVTSKEVRSNLFSSEPLTPADLELYENCLCPNEESDPEIARKSVVPSILPRGSQGLIAMLYAIFNGRVLLSAAVDEPYPIHADFIKNSHLALLFHEGKHLEVLTQNKVLTSVAPKLKSIFDNIVHPESNVSPEAAKKNLVVLHQMLHESTGWNTMLHPPANSKPLNQFRTAFSTPYWVSDVRKLLNKGGFFIPPVEHGEVCFEAVAQAMDAIWKEFRQQHFEALKTSGLFKLQNLLAD